MGIIYSNAALLAKAKQKNVSFDRLLTIGHLSLYLSQTQIKRLAQFIDLDIDPLDFSYKQYANKFFEKFLGAQVVKSLDYSDYQEYDILLDINYPIDSRHYIRKTPIPR